MALVNDSLSHTQCSFYRHGHMDLPCDIIFDQDGTVIMVDGMACGELESNPDIAGLGVSWHLLWLDE